MFCASVLDYRLNGNEEARDRTLDVFDYLHDQGWADGSGVGAMHHEFLRVLAMPMRCI